MSKVNHGQDDLVLAVPAFIAQSGFVSPRALRVYGLLLKLAQGKPTVCMQSQEWAAKQLGVCRRTIMRSLDDLQLGGLIDWKVRGLNQPNIYTIKKVVDPSAGCDQPDETSVCLGPKTGTKVRRVLTKRNRDVTRKSNVYVEVTFPNVTPGVTSGCDKALPAVTLGNKVSRPLSDVMRECARELKLNYNYKNTDSQYLPSVDIDRMSPSETCARMHLRYILKATRKSNAQPFGTPMEDVYPNESESGRLPSCPSVSSREDYSSECREEISRGEDLHGEDSSAEGVARGVGYSPTKTHKVVNDPTKSQKVGYPATLKFGQCMPNSGRQIPSTLSRLALYRNSSLRRLYQNWLQKPATSWRYLEIDYLIEFERLFPGITGARWPSYSTAIQVMKNGQQVEFKLGQVFGHIISELYKTHGYNKLKQYLCFCLENWEELRKIRSYPEFPDIWKIVKDYKTLFQYFDSGHVSVAKKTSDFTGLADDNDLENFIGEESGEEHDTG
jgi:hypothetical protein